MRFSTCRMSTSPSSSAEQVLEALADVAHLEDFLLLLELQRQVRGDGVGQPAAVVDARHRRQDFRRNLLVELHVLVELREQRAAHRLDLVRAARIAGHRRALRPTGIRLRSSTRTMRARCVPSTSTFTVPSGSFSICSTVATLPMSYRSSARGLVLGRRLLRDEQDVLAGFHRHVERLDRLRAPDEQRDDHVREHDDVAQRQQRQVRSVSTAEVSVGGHVCPQGGSR